MYKLLMVDDEDIIRNGFRDRIDWVAAGFQFLPPCGDGQQAMETIDRESPDVVITDICMPLADGLEIAAWIAVKHPKTIVVVLSGYDDFEYARTSIRNRVWDYILKPVTAHEIIELLSRLKNKLDTERKSSGNTTDAALRETELRRFLANDPGSQEIGRNIIGSDPDSLNFCSVSIEIYCTENGIENRNDSVSKLEKSLMPLAESAFETGAEQDIQSCALLVQYDLASSDLLPGRVKLAELTTVVFDTLPERATNLALARSRLFAESMKRMGYSVAGGVGLPHPGAAGARQSLDEARRIAERRLIAGEGIFQYDPSRSAVPAEKIPKDDFIERICAAIRTRDDVNFTRLFNEWLELLKFPGISSFRLRQSVQQLLIALSDLNSPLIGDPAVSSGNDEAHVRVVDLICGESDLKAVVRLLGERAMAAVQFGGSGSAEQKIVEFKSYISQHFQAENLSITLVGNDLHVSPSYLSKILKRHLDCSFVDYITDYRLERAKELLAGSDRKTYEIAEAIGYHDARYFSTVFKRLTGLSPTEYRSQRHQRI